MSAESTRGAPATLGGVPLKHLSLVTLIVQNSALILIMHYSRVMPPVNGQRYFASTSVFLNEVIKLGISLSMALYDTSMKLPPNTTVMALCQNLFSSVFTHESWKLGVPALLYTIQNNLQYVAVSNLDAATFQVTYQLKILTTALFSVMLLGRKLSSRKWLSLFLLIIGVSIVQLPQPQSLEPSGADIVKESTESKIESRSFDGVLHSFGRYVMDQLTKRSATYEGIAEDENMLHPEMNRSVGLAAVMVSCALSGLAGVFFEKILKDSTTKNVSLWVRNVQLTFWSLFPAFFLGVVIKDGEQIAKAGFFAGYNWVVWTVILFQAAGGVIVSLVINYADNIAKNFATSISIIASCLASIYFFGFKATLPFFVGTGVVLFATYLYTQPERPSRPAYIRIANYENATVDGNPVLYDSNKSGAMPRSPRRAPEGFHTPLAETPTVEMKQFPFPKRDD